MPNSLGRFAFSESNTMEIKMSMQVIRPNSSLASYPVSTASFFLSFFFFALFFSTCKKKLAVETGYEANSLPYSFGRQCKSKCTVTLN